MKTLQGSNAIQFAYCQDYIRRTVEDGLKSSEIDHTALKRSIRMQGNGCEDCQPGLETIGLRLSPSFLKPM